MYTSSVASSVPAEAVQASAPTLPWHFTAHTGINAEVLHPEALGQGVVVAVLDDGFDIGHPALSARFDADLSWDFRDGDPDPSNSAGERHGTRVMGVIGADGSTGAAVGIAPGATLAGVRIGYGPAGNATQYAKALAHAAARADVINNSWNYSSPFADDFSKAAFKGASAALEAAARDGRGGLGSIIVFAAGNTGLSGDDVNAHDFANDIHVIAVGGSDEKGGRAAFATPGAPILVSAPAIKIQTTEARIVSGVAEVAASGVSQAAAAVSGVAALLIAANPNLGWRDVQEILALTARHVDPGGGVSQTNGATWINGGGLVTNREIGFGVVDAAAAVRLAATWEGARTSSNMTAASGVFSTAGQIESSKPIQRTVRLDESLDVDHVVLDVALNHQRIGDLRIVLISPSGTESILLDRIGVTATKTAGIGAKVLSFGLSSTEFWGERSDGVWTLRVEDLATGADGWFASATLHAYGDVAEQNNFVFTDAFARLGNETERLILRLVAEDHTLNAAALSDSFVFDLERGGVIAGHGVAVEGSGHIARVIGGAGDDTMRAASWGVQMSGGDGDDLILGGSGDDTLDGGRGDDIMAGGFGHDIAVFSGTADQYSWSLNYGEFVEIDIVGPDGADQIRDVEIFSFSDFDIAVSDMISSALPNSLTVFAGGTGGPNAHPEFSVFVDGVFVGAAVIDTPQTYAERRLEGWTSEAFVFDISLEEPPQSVVITFNNDGRDQDTGEDVNLFIDAIEVSGHRQEAEYEGYFYASGPAENRNGPRQTLFWNGEIHFDIRDDWM